jgi:hypothetical protein
VTQAADSATHPLILETTRRTLEPFGLPMVNHAKA